MQHGIHHKMIATWKRQSVELMPGGGEEKKKALAPKLMRAIDMAFPRQCHVSEAATWFGPAAFGAGLGTPLEWPV